MAYAAYDVAVAGGGLAGLTLALALHKAGARTVLIDGEPLETRTAPSYDGRASALAYTSFRLLETLGAGARLREAAQVQRIEDILVVDGRPGDGVRRGGFGPFSLHFDRREIAPDDDGEPLGWMAENRHTRLALAAEIEASGLEVRAPVRAAGYEALPGKAVLHLECGDAIEARLVAACDGRRSALREQAGIRSFGGWYGQTGIVLNVEHEAPHHGVAYECFMPAGPFAILPLPGNRASLVWTERDAAAKALLAADEARFQAALEARFGDFLGAVKPESPCFSYPLGLQVAERFTADRLALVGDAARGIHPIAGQGFNLGVRDAAALAEVVVEALSCGLDPGAAPALSRYDRWRRLDSTLLALGTDAFNRLFSNDISPLRAVRGLGLGLVDRIPAARRFFMREAGGETGDLPRLLQGEILSV